MMDLSMRKLDEFKNIRPGDEVCFFVDASMHLPWQKGIVKEILSIPDGIYFNINWYTGGNSLLMAGQVFKTEIEIEQRLSKNRELENLDQLFDFCLEIMRNTDKPDDVSIEIAETQYKKIKQHIDEYIVSLKIKLNSIYGVNSPFMMTMAGKTAIDSNGMRELNDYCTDLYDNLVRTTDAIKNQTDNIQASINAINACMAECFKNKES